MNEDKKELMLLELEMIKADLEEILDDLIDDAQNEIHHYGVVGMKWGVRRFNESRTNESRTIN